MGAAASYTRLEGDPHDWATVCRWEDAGRPPLPREHPRHDPSTNHDTNNESGEQR